MTLVVPEARSIDVQPHRAANMAADSKTSNSISSLLDLCDGTIYGCSVMHLHHLLKC